MCPGPSPDSGLDLRVPSSLSKRCSPHFVGYTVGLLAAAALLPELSRKAVRVEVLEIRAHWGPTVVCRCPGWVVGAEWAQGGQEQVATGHGDKRGHQEWVWWSILGALHFGGGGTIRFAQGSLMERLRGPFGVPGTELGCKGDTLLCTITLAWHPSLELREAVSGAEGQGAIWVLGPDHTQ